MEELINKGNIEKYMADKNMVEFPNENIVYDVKSNSWKARIP
jgi:hypothetical protein